MSSNVSSKPSGQSTMTPCPTCLYDSTVAQSAGFVVESLAKEGGGNGKSREARRKSEIREAKEAYPRREAKEKVTALIETDDSFVYPNHPTLVDMYIIQYPRVIWYNIVDTSAYVCILTDYRCCIMNTTVCHLCLALLDLRAKAYH